jgi:hypothetical protein
LVPSTVKLLHREKERKNQWGSGVLQAWPETGSLEIVAKVFVLFLCGVQLVLRSGVLTVLDLDEVDVAPSFVKVFRSVLSGVAGSQEICVLFLRDKCAGRICLFAPATTTNSIFLT